MKRWKDTHRRGVAVVEMALVLPLFFTIVLGIIEFGRALMVSQLVTNAAREAARRAVLNGATNASIDHWIRDYLSTTLNIEPDVIDVSITVTPAQGNPDPENQLENALTGDLCTIRVAVPFDQVSFLPARYLIGKELTAQSSMRHE